MSHHTVIAYVLRKLQPMTAEELAKECEISLQSSRQCLNHMHAGKKVHIKEWVKTPKNQFAAVYANGEGEDARKPTLEKPERPKPTRRRHPVVAQIASLSDDFRNPFATAMWNVAQVSGERG